jgi:hypothetical protein
MSAKRDAPKTVTRYQGIRGESKLPVGRIVEKVFTNTNKETVINAYPKTLLNTFDEHRNIIELTSGRKILAIRVALYVFKLKLKNSDSENGKTNIKTYHIDVNHTEERQGIRKSLPKFFQCEILFITPYNPMKTATELINIPVAKVK